MAERRRQQAVFPERWAQPSESVDWRIARRGFLKLGAIGAGGLLLKPPRRRKTSESFPDSEKLGRVCVDQVAVRARADIDSQTVGTLPRDSVVAWLREKVGRYPQAINQTFVETPDGFIYAPALQPVENKPNPVIGSLPQTSLGPGMWAEVTVPWVALELGNPPPRAFWLKHTDSPRFYYSQILWVDEIKTDDTGQVWYRTNERFGYRDLLWGPGEAFRPLTPEDMTPLSPEVENKQVVVDVTTQTMSCLEDDREVYFARVSTGGKFDEEGNPVDRWSTPMGGHPIWRKVVSLHMVGGTTGGGYDLPGIGWTTLFAGNGVAIHSTFWHNDFGVPRSHGCVNARPADARWVFRWVLPEVPYDPGDVTVEMPGGTRVVIVES